MQANVNLALWVLVNKNLLTAAQAETAVTEMSEVLADIPGYNESWKRQWSASRVLEKLAKKNLIAQAGALVIVPEVIQLLENRLRIDKWWMVQANAAYLISFLGDQSLKKALGQNSFVDIIHQMEEIVKEAKA